MAAILWAEDHGGFMPTNLIAMSNELNTPKILSCITLLRVSNWSDFHAANSTYEILSPGISREETNKVFLRCKIHGHLGYTDGTVFDGKRRRKKFD